MKKSERRPSLQDIEKVLKYLVEEVRVADDLTVKEAYQQITTEDKR